MMEHSTIHLQVIKNRMVRSQRRTGNEAIEIGWEVVPGGGVVSEPGPRGSGSETRGGVRGTLFTACLWSPGSALRARLLLHVVYP